jgi:hypothetical protein
LNFASLARSATPINMVQSAWKLIRAAGSRLLTCDGVLYGCGCIFHITIEICIVFQMTYDEFLDKLKSTVKDFKKIRGKDPTLQELLAFAESRVLRPRTKGLKSVRGMV